jgi:hypothetical protein
MEDYLRTYTLFRKIDRISDLVTLCPMENEAAFVTLQNFGREAYGMFWSTEEMLMESELPSATLVKKITIPKLGSAAGWDVLAPTWKQELTNRNGDTITTVEVAAIEDEVLDRIDKI